MKVAVLTAFTLFVVALVGTTVAARLVSDADSEGSVPSVGQSPTATATGTVTAAIPSTTATPAGAAAAPSAGATTAAPTPAAAQPVAGYTTADVARHNSPSDCWIIVAGRIYDVTAYLRSHPGGAETITPWCGKESTVAYETEDGVGTHSSRADRLLEGYYLADLRR